MKKIFLCLIMFLCTTAYGEETSPRFYDFDEIIKSYSIWEENLFEPLFYEHFEWTDVNKKVIKFNDLTDFEKDQFFISQANQITQELSFLNQKWIKENNSVLKGVSPPFDTFSKKLLDELHSGLLNLQKLRTQCAEKIEPFVETTLGKNKAVISENERNFVLRRMKNWHKAQGLISK